MEENKAELYQKLVKQIDTWEIEELLKKAQSMASFSDKEYKDILFCTLLIFHTESTLKRVLQKTMLDSLKTERQYPELVSLIFDETTFSSKIKIMEFIINNNEDRKKQFKDFFSYCRALNDLRNQIFHTKLEAIKYCGLSVTDVITQRKMLKDLIEARLKFGTY